jgi:hypothetical protein
MADCGAAARVLESSGGMAVRTSANDPTEFSPMLRFLFPCTFFILVVESAVFGQGLSDGRKSSLSGPTPDSPPAVGLSSSFQSNASAAPDSVDDYLAQASRHSARGELDAAIQTYKVVLQKDPKSPEAYAGLTPGGRCRVSGVRRHVSGVGYGEYRCQVSEVREGHKKS